MYTVYRILNSIQYIHTVLKLSALLFAIILNIFTHQSASEIKVPRKTNQSNKHKEKSGAVCLPELATPNLCPI